MWCKRCAQDVPGVPALEDGAYCCPRCGDGIALPRTDGEAQAEGDASCVDAVAAGVETAALLPPFHDAWESDEQLRHVGRILESGATTQCAPRTPHAPREAATSRTPHAPREAAPPEAATLPISQSSSQEPRFRIDAPHGSPSACHAAPTRTRVAPQAPETAEPGSVFAGLIWLALAAGTTAFACGGILLGWSIATGRQELWTIGTPVALAGQIALAVGLILQLDRLWRHSHTAAEKLDDVDEQLHELKTATTLLGTTHSSPAAAFYAHLADGASPQLLLTDLKSQLDLLATKLSRTSR